MQHKWVWDEDKGIGYKETNDPRVVAVVVEDGFDSKPCTDELAPSYWIDDMDAAESTGCYDTEDSTRWLHFILDRRNEFGEALESASSLTEAQRAEAADAIVRDMCAREGVTFRELDLYMGARLLIINTPEWRWHNGYSDDTDLRDTVRVWKAWAAGEVYGVGYAVLDRSDFSEPVVLNEQDFVVQWGVFGKDVAMHEAESFTWWECPDLPPLNPA